MAQDNPVLLSCVPFPLPLSFRGRLLCALSTSFPHSLTHSLTWFLPLSPCPFPPSTHPNLPLPPLPSPPHSIPGHIIRLAGTVASKCLFATPLRGTASSTPCFHDEHILLQNSRPLSGSLSAEDCYLTCGSEILDGGARLSEK